MYDIDVMPTHTQLDRRRDEADSTKQQLNMILKPFKNLTRRAPNGVLGIISFRSYSSFFTWDLVYEHGTKEADKDVVWKKGQEPNKNIHHLSQLMALDQAASAAVIQYGISEIPRVRKVCKKRKKRIGYRVPMTTEEEQNSWRKFQELAERDNWSARLYVRVPGDEVVLDLGEPIVHLLAKFAVDAYNAICMKARVSVYERIFMTSILEFKYIMRFDVYINYITIEVIDDGIKSIYEAMVQTLPSNGKKTLVEIGPATYWAPFAEEEKKEAEKINKPIKSWPRAKKGKKKAKEAAGGIGLAEKEKVENSALAEWREMRKQRLAAMIDPPSSSGLDIHTEIGSYCYLNPMKEFRIY